VDERVLNFSWSHTPSLGRTAVFPDVTGHTATGSPILTIDETTKRLLSFTTFIKPLLIHRTALIRPFNIPDHGHSTQKTPSFI
jgi:hypothetical protein